MLFTKLIIGKCDSNPIKSNRIQELMYINSSPNPATDEVLIYQTGEKEMIKSVQVFDMQGRLIIQENTNSDTGLNRFSVNQLSNGIYLCVFEMPALGRKTAKLIVEQ